MTGFKSKKEMAMSKMSDLAYDIEQMYIEGISPKRIAEILECPIETVYDWIDGEGLSGGEDLDPYNTINS